MNNQSQIDLVDVLAIEEIEESRDSLEISGPDPYSSSVSPIFALLLGVLFLPLSYISKW